jgi:hypothetical protein
MRATLRLAALVVICGLPASTAFAQQTVVNVVDFLVTNQTVPTADFERDRQAAEAARDTIARALLVNLTSVPLATSSGGFLYRLNPQLGTVERASETFGGFFVERALTAGGGQASFGVSAYTSAYSRLNGANLRDGSFVTVANRFTDEATPFDSDTLTLRVRTNTLTVFGAYGVTDALEVSAAVPLVQVHVDGRRLNTYFGDANVQATGEASASGIGDVALRTKYMLVSGETGAFSVGGEVRLPTGDENNLLGAGAAAIRLFGIGSYESGPLAVHVNGGIVRGGVSDELNAAGAASYAVRPTVTVAGELLIRRVNELPTLGFAAGPHPTKIDVETLRLSPEQTGLTLAHAVAGVKWNVHKTLVLGAHVVFPLVRRGLTAPITPTLSVEYGF